MELVAVQLHSTSEQTRSVKLVAQSQKWHNVLPKIHLTLQAGEQIIEVGVSEAVFPAGHHAVYFITRPTICRWQKGFVFLGDANKRLQVTIASR